MSGEEWETFARVTGVAFDDGGNLYLLDADNFRVVKVGPDGDLLAEMGGEGDGPGEFGMPVALSVTRAGEVRVFDLGYGGFVLFDGEGGYLGSVPMDPGTVVFPSGILPSHPEGGMVLAGGGGMAIRRGPDGSMEFPNTRPVNLFTLADQVEVATVYEGWNPATAEGTASLRTTSGGGISIQAPVVRAFDPEMLVGVFPDGRIAVADSTTYEVKVMNLEGVIEDVIRRPFTPRQVTQEDRDAEKRRQLDAMLAAGGPRFTMRTDEGALSTLASGQATAMMEALIEGMEFGPEIPLISDMAVDWDGRAWIERSGPSVGEEGPLDLIDGDGTYLGTLSPGEGKIPDAFGPGGLAAFIETDELDVPTVVVRRLAIRRVLGAPTPEGGSPLP